MAKPPAAAPMSDDDMADDGADAGGADAGTEGENDEDAGNGDDAGDENVLLTVCKEADGTYSLIKGDEEDADGADAAGSADTAGTDEASGKQSFDSKGALLKGILDILNEDEESSGADGSSGDQFQAGFDENAPAKPATTMAQKY